MKGCEPSKMLIFLVDVRARVPLYFLSLYHVFPSPFFTSGNGIKGVSTHSHASKASSTDGESR